MGRTKSDKKDTPPSPPPQAPPSPPPQAPPPSQVATPPTPAPGTYYCKTHGPVPADRVLTDEQGHKQCPICRTFMSADAPTPVAPTHTPSKDTPTTPQIQNEEEMLVKYITSTWTTDVAKAKLPGIMLHMQDKGWHNLKALNWVLAKLGCPVGELEVILTNWRAYLIRADPKHEIIDPDKPPEPTKDQKEGGEAAKEGETPPGGVSDKDVDSELNRLSKVKTRTALLRELDKKDDGGVPVGDVIGKSVAEGVRPVVDAVAKLAERMEQAERDRERRETEERHRREMDDLRRELTAKAAPPQNTVRRQIAAVDPATGHAVTDEEGRPVFNVIEEPWTAPTSRETEKDSDLVKAVTKLVESKSSPESDPRIASMETELKSLSAQLADKKQEEVLNRAVAPFYEFMQKSQIEHGVEERIGAKLKEMGVGGGQNAQVQAQSQENMEMIKGGFAMMNTGLQRADHRMAVIEKAVTPLMQNVGKVLDKELGGSEGERPPGAADRDMGERAGGEEVTDLPPEDLGSDAAQPPPETQQPAKRVHEL